jgi:peptidoglycan/LPS O-acetylase OafA/YrhL
LDGKTIRYRVFLWNRGLRPLALLCLVLFLIGVQKYQAGEDIFSYARSLSRGVLFPTLSNGWRPITVEFHFYLILPVFLFRLPAGSGL